MAKGRRVSGISVPIQLDTSAVQRDMEALGSDLSTTINKVSKSLDGALNPKAILKGVVDLNKALGQMRDSAKIWDQMGDSQSKFSKQIIELRPQLKSLAQEFGGTIKQQRELMTMLVKNQAVAQEVDSLRLWEKQLGKTKEEVVQLFRERGKMVSADAIKEFIPNSTVENAKKLKEEYKELAKLAGAVESKEGLKKYVDTANIKQAVSAFQQLNGAQKITAADFEQIAKGAKVSTDAVKRYVNEMQRAANSARGWTGIFTPTSVAAGAQSAMAAMGVVGGMYGVVELGKAMFDASLKMDSLSVAFKSIYNNAETADAQLKFVASTSDTLGLSFTASAEGAKKLFAAAQGTEVQDNVNEIFKSFSMMGTALKLTGDEMNSVFLALSQMISKGKVSAEELRLQLAERMPGAVQLFAKSMDVTTKELDKLLQEGKVGLSDLVKFSETVGKTYSFGALEASRSLQSEMNRVQNEWFNLKKAFVDSNAAAGVMRWLSETLKDVVGYAPAIKETAIVVGQLGASFAAFKILSSIVPLFKSFIGAMSISPVSALVVGLGAFATAMAAIERHLHKNIPLVEDYGVAFSDLQKFAESAATAVGNTATVVYERQKAEYEKLKNDMKEGLSGGFASMFDSLKTAIDNPSDASFDFKSLIKANEIADLGRKAAEEFSKEFNKALQEGDEAGQQKAVAKYEATARAILENVNKYADLLPEGFKASIDKMLGSVSNLYMTMEDRGARLRDGAFASAIKELGLSLPKFTAEFEKLQKAAANTPFGKLEKKDLVSEDAVKSIAAMATALGEAQQKFNDFNAAAEKNGTTSEALAAAQDALNGYYDTFKTALNNAGAAALANGTSLDTFKEGVINMLNQAGLAAPILEHLTGIVRNFGAEVQAAAEAANAKWADNLLTRFKTMGLKQGSEEYEAAKKKHDLDEINKKLAEGAINQDKANELINEMNAGYARQADLLNDRVGKSLERAQNKLENYADSLKALSAEVQNLEIAYNDQNSTAKEAMLLAEKNTAIAKAQAKADQDIRKKNATAAEATAYVELSTKKAELDYALKLRETEEKTSEARLNFYKDLSAFSGEYEQTAVYQNKLLETQARLWRNLGIPMADINKMIEYQRKEMSKDFTDGATRGLEKYIAKAKDFAAQAESMVTSFVQGFEDATTKMFTDFFETGKVTLDSFKSIFTSMLNDLVRIAVVRPITVQLATSLLGGVGTVAGAASGSASTTGGVYDQASGVMRQYGVSQLTSGALGATGLTGTINGWGASMFPSVFAENAAVNAALNNATLQTTWLPGTLPTSTLLGTLGAAGMGFGLGSMGGSLLAGLTGGDSAAMSTGGGIGGGLGAGIGSIIAPGIGTFIGGALGTLLGSGAGGLFSGGLFGGGGSEPGLWVLGNIDLDASDTSSQMEAISRPNKGRSGFADATAQGYYIQARSRNGMDASAASNAAKYLSQLADQVINLSSSVKTSLGAIDGDLGTKYSDYLAAQKWIQVTGNGEGDDTPNVEELGKNLINQAYGRITDAVAHMDLSKVAIAADGMAADTMAEMSKAITKAAGIANISQSMGDYADEYLAAIGKPLLDALNTIDTSKLPLTVDKSSLAGWSVAATAIQAMSDVKTSISGILTPASELTTAMTTANTQLDTWIASLKQLGWQESAIAEVEAKRTAYLEQYQTALARSAEQDLQLRLMSLTSGTDAWGYKTQALKYQQENELADYAKKYGSEAELLAAKAAQLNKEAYKGKTDWDNNSVYEAIKDAGMTVVEWLERFGRAEGFTQNIAMYDQLMYTQQAESIRAEIEYLQSQYSEMLQAQITSVQSLVNSFERVISTLDDARRSLWSGDSNISTSRLDTVRADFASVYAKAMSGDTEAMAELPNISTNLLQLGKEELNSRATYEDLFYDVNSKLKDAEDLAKNQYDTNKMQLDALQKQLDTLQSQLDVQKKSSLTLDEISAKITALSGDLAAAMAKAAKTPLAQTESLLQSKADLLNKQAYQGRTDWTAQSTQQAILSSGMTVDQWWARFGVGEGVSNSYTSSSSGMSDMALLAAKAASMNAGNTLASGQSAGGWTAASVAQAIADSGMTISQWYQNFGKAEGFATGGITPANEPFWVGEHGKELVVSPRQYGVLSNSDSMRLVGGNQTSENNSSSSSSMLTALMQEMILILRQSLTRGTNTDKFIEKMYNIFDKWDVDGAPAVRV